METQCSKFGQVLVTLGNLFAILFPKYFGLETLSICFHILELKCEQNLLVGFLNHYVEKEPLSSSPTEEQFRHFLTAQWGYFDLPETRSLVQMVTVPLDTFVCLWVWPETSGWDRNSQPLCSLFTDRSWMIWVWGKEHTQQCPGHLF